MSNYHRLLLGKKEEIKYEVREAAFYVQHDLYLSQNIYESQFYDTFTIKVQSN